jgi:hypothetical protein
MSETVSLHDDPKYSRVVTDLDNIETILLENGKLMALTGTVASSVTIEFGMYGEGKDAEPSILIRVTTPDEIDPEEDVLDDFEDFVIEELEAASREWSQEVKDSLGDNRQIILLINDEEF